VLFHEREQGGRIIQVDAWLESSARHSRESYRRAFFCFPLASQHLAQRILYDGRQRLVRACSNLLDLNQQVIVESNRCSHASKHIIRSSRCQTVVRLVPPERLCPVVITWSNQVLPLCGPERARTARTRGGDRHRSGLAFRHHQHLRPLECMLSDATYNRVSLITRFVLEGKPE
jgi:hypothetical protein